MTGFVRGLLSSSSSSIKSTRKIAALMHNGTIATIARFCCCSSFDFPSFGAVCIAYIYADISAADWPATCRAYARPSISTGSRFLSPPCMRAVRCTLLQSRFFSFFFFCRGRLMRDASLFWGLFFLTFYPQMKLKERKSTCTGFFQLLLLMGVSHPFYPHFWFQRSL